MSKLPKYKVDPKTDFVPWYKDRDFPEIKSSNADIVAIVNDHEELQRVLTVHNELVENLEIQKAITVAEMKANTKLQQEVQQLKEGMNYNAQKNQEICDELTQAYEKIDTALIENAKLRDMKDMPHGWLSESGRQVKLAWAKSEQLQKDMLQLTEANDTIKSESDRLKRVVRYLYFNLGYYGTPYNYEGNYGGVNEDKGRQAREAIHMMNRLGFTNDEVAGFKGPFGDKESLHNPKTVWELENE